MSTVATSCIAFILLIAVRVGAECQSTQQLVREITQAFVGKKFVTSCVHDGGGTFRFEIDSFQVEFNVDSTKFSIAYREKRTTITDPATVTDVENWVIFVDLRAMASIDLFHLEPYGNCLNSKKQKLHVTYLRFKPSRGHRVRVLHGQTPDEMKSESRIVGLIPIETVACDQCHDALVSGFRKLRLQANQ